MEVQYFEILFHDHTFDYAKSFEYGIFCQNINYHSFWRECLSLGV